MLKHIITLIMFIYCSISYSQTSKIVIKQFDFFNLPSTVSIFNSNYDEIFRSNQPIDSFLIQLDGNKVQKLILILDDKIQSPLNFFVLENSYTIIIYKNDINYIEFINSKLNNQYYYITKLINDLNRKNLYSYRKQKKNTNITKNKVDSLKTNYKRVKKEILKFEKNYYKLIPNSYLSLNYLYDECIKQQQNKNTLDSFFNILSIDSLSKFKLYNIVNKILKYQQYKIGMSFPSIELENESFNTIDIKNVIDSNTTFIYLWDPLCRHSTKLNKEIETFINSHPKFSKRIISINRNFEMKDHIFPWRNYNASYDKVLELKMKLWSHKVPDGFIIKNKKIVKMHVKFKEFLDYVNIK